MGQWCEIQLAAKVFHLDVAHMLQKAIHIDVGRPKIIPYREGVRLVDAVKEVGVDGDAEEKNSGDHRVQALSCRRHRVLLSGVYSGKSGAQINTI